MFGLPRQALQILKLGPAIAVPEWMDVVKVADDRAGRRREGPAMPAAQEIGVAEPAMHVGHTCLDEAAKLKLMTVLGDLHRAHLTRPVVDVLEQMAMDGLQVGEVKVSWRHTFGDALGHELAFDALQSGRVKNAKFISENGSVWIEVRVLSAHSAASGVTAARIWASRRSCGQASRSNISNIATSSGDNGLPSIS